MFFFSLSLSLSHLQPPLIGTKKRTMANATLAHSLRNTSALNAHSVHRTGGRRCTPLRAAPATKKKGESDYYTTTSTIVDRRSLLLGTIGTSCGLAITPAARALDTGAKAVNFTLPGTDGETIELDAVLSQNDFVTLYFYNQDGSPGCSIEAQRFEAAIPEFKSRKTRVLGVSMDSLDKHEEFCSSKGLKSFTLLSDNDGKVSEAYGADLKIPLLGRFSDRQTFLIKKDGTIIGHWLERDQSMASVKTTAHVDQILAAIDAA